MLVRWSTTLPTLKSTSVVVVFVEEIAQRTGTPFRKSRSTRPYALHMPRFWLNDAWFGADVSVSIGMISDPAAKSVAAVDSGAAGELAAPVSAAHPAAIATRTEARAVLNRRSSVPRVDFRCRSV